MVTTRQKFYTLKKILKHNAQYNVIFGERSNGKTFSVLLYALENYINGGEQLAIVRRWQDDFTGKRGSVLWDGIVAKGLVSKLTNGEWTGVYYYASKWYLCKYENNIRITDENPIAYGFSVSSMEHDKSTSYPYITTIMFDEFITRQTYITDEFVLFMNVVSTIVRHRKNVKIFMLGNTVNRYCPYFKEMGLTHIKMMKPGDIDVYKYGDSDLKVAVEYTEPTVTGKDSDIYFAFNNPKLAMITGGVWEMELYPHCPIKYRPKDVVFNFFIEFDDNILQGEVVCFDKHDFIFIHRKTTEIKEPERDIIYSPEYSSLPNHRRKLTNPQDNIDRKIANYFIKEKVFYSDNEVGEVVLNYLKWCKKG